ncbi:MAG: pyridoxamine 5'-phosphate oxidase family protein [Gemmatimonadaceae bacterium]|nr:pyridoxamine 5'-phosphate oxidase family protein [Chitinophagaceae bacterium]
MDSINKEQQEKNHEDLYGSEAAKKIKELGEKAKNCFFCTNIGSGHQFTTRPMSFQKIDDQGICWFLSAADSHKNKEIQHDPAVQLLFHGSTHSDFVSIYGTATISRDKEKIKELWEPLLKTWFTEGIDDPRITVIKVTPKDGYYWDTKHGEVIAFAKMIAGAIAGKTMDDSIEGKLKV